MFTLFPIYVYNLWILAVEPLLSLSLALPSSLYINTLFKSCIITFCSYPSVYVNVLFTGFFLLPRNFLRIICFYLQTYLMFYDVFVTFFNSNLLWSLCIFFRCWFDFVQLTTSLNNLNKINLVWQRVYVFCYQFKRLLYLWSVKWSLRDWKWFMS